MSNVLAAATAAKIQEIRAQSLATMLSIIGAASPASQAGARPAGGGVPEETAAEGSAATIRAILVEMQAGNRALVQLAGGYAEVELPPALMRQLAAAPAGAKPGALLLLPAEIPARPVAGPATAVSLPAAGTVPLPVPGPFPPGSLGAALMRMTGIATPSVEPAPPVLGTNVPGSTPLRAAPLPSGLSAPLAEAALQGAARQLPMATVLSALMARLGLPTDPAAPLPPSVRAALEALLPLRNTPASLATPEGLRQALAQSGAFLENQLARLPAGAPMQDLKAALLGLRQAAADAGSEGTTMAEIGRLAEGGVERIKLLQLASMPGHPDSARLEEASQGFRLALSVPLAPQGPDRPQTAMMGVMIEHHPAAPAEPEDATAREGSGEAQPFPWKVRIALDLEETGPVEAEIGLRGHAVSVQLWAEQPGMAKCARAAIGDLHAALSGAAFEIIRLDVHDGRATPRPSLPSPYLDRRT